ncbi:MAG: DnaK suppressor protein [Gammaproteobacteria bacterium]|jgi:DnaK suppressor protein
MPDSVDTEPNALDSAPNDGAGQSIAPYCLKEGEAFMSDAQVAHFRLLLSHWRNELMGEVDRTVSHMRDDASQFPDPNDRASQEAEFALELRTRDRERKLINKINESLATLDVGEYGFCETCGEEIGLRRLEARPTATHCIDCKTAQERKELQPG